MLVLSLLLAAPLCAADPKETKRVLVLYSEDKALPAHELTDQGLRATFQSDRLFDVQLFSEYMDHSPFYSAGHGRTVAEYLRRKYADIKILETSGVPILGPVGEFLGYRGMTRDIKSGDVLDAIPNDIALCLYRIIQEGLRNIAKHAKTNEACIVLDGLDGAVTLLIQDPGIGFDLKEVKGQLGIGLTGMKERVRLVGGTMSLRSQPGEGTEIQISIPFGGKHG
ncbi:MAG: ATP-binding protein [Syntrophobacteraceae bacterium]